MKVKEESEKVVLKLYIQKMKIMASGPTTSLNLAIRGSWSEPQSAPGLVFADCTELLHLWLQRI